MFGESPGGMLVRCVVWSLLAVACACWAVSPPPGFAGAGWRWAYAAGAIGWAASALGNGVEFVFEARAEREQRRRWAADEARYASKQ